ncbi:ribosomal-protein-alanine N-acetyltransferase [Pseudobutyrivibrio sp. YE44]|uniref:GNAT family N-acetyltransferase n=1 Tax=Pseudobutyrivibrio sp. YE44 TaxID=1520802 RepID=UPI000880F1BF|nr:GNAT family protein [Pseudobutyrivibrio sp. YE44]SDB52846.1 ribosomal-protein-alanine N-acetyltransferase [Pseudobutyrivibrio sp. YE44]
MKFEINTERLDLRVLTKQNADMVLDFYIRNRDIFEKYEPVIGDDFYTLAHQQKILDFEYQNILKMVMMRYWIFEKDNPCQIIGTVSYRNIVRPIYESCTVGYKMDRDYTNRGYCSEALANSIPLLAKELGIHRFEALILPDNDPSIHMVEKLGFKFEGILRDKIIINGERLDHCMFSYLANN